MTTLTTNSGTKIAFTGDFRLRIQPGVAATQQVQLCPEIVGVLGACDHVVVNLEGPLTAAPPMVTKGVVLASDPQAAKVLRDLNCTVLNLGNNHLFDHGLAGYQDSLEIARQFGWRWFGAGRNLEEAALPVVLPLKGGRVGMLAVCDRWEDKVATESRPGVYCHSNVAEVRQRMQDLRKNCRWVGINYHGGEELFRMPMPARRRRLLDYAQAGADFVIAHHAHVVQGYERLGERLIFYGLGDFLFDVDHFVDNPDTDESVVPILEFCQSGEIRFQAAFTRFNRSTKTLQMTSANEAFREISAPTYDAEYGDFSMAKLREWMTIRGIAQPSFFRKLRRLFGMALNLRGPYTRPVLIAAYRAILGTLLRCKLGSADSVDTSSRTANVDPHAR